MFCAFEQGCLQSRYPDVSLWIVGFEIEVEMIKVDTAIAKRNGDMNAFIIKKLQGARVCFDDTPAMQPLYQFQLSCKVLTQRGS